MKMMIQGLNVTANYNQKHGRYDCRVTAPKCDGVEFKIDGPEMEREELRSKIKAFIAPLMNAGK